MKDCIFCKIIKGEVPSKIVFENDEMIVFENINKCAKIHLLAIPKRHYAFLSEANGSDEIVLGKMLTTIAKNASDWGLFDGYRLSVNQGKNAGQEVFHLHIHILGGEKLKSF